LRLYIQNTILTEELKERYEMIKKLKLLWLIRNVSKSMAFGFSPSGANVLDILYMELEDTLDVEKNDEPEDEEEEMGFHG